MGCFPHCEFEDAKEMYMNARALFERPSTVATSLAQMKSPGVSTGGRPGFFKVSSPDLASASSPRYAPASVITVSSEEDVAPASSEGQSPRHSTHRRHCQITRPPRTIEMQYEYEKALVLT